MSLLLSRYSWNLTEDYHSVFSVGVVSIYSLKKKKRQKNECIIKYDYFAIMIYETHSTILESVIKIVLKLKSFNSNCSGC